MWNTKTLMLAVSMCFAWWVTPVDAADVAKIGICDLQRVLTVSEAGKAAKAEIDKQSKQIVNDLKQKETELKELKEKLDREKLVLSKEKRDEKEREFRIKVNDFKSLEKRYKSQFRDLDARLSQRIQTEVLKIVEEIGRKEGYLLIIGKREAGVMYSPNTNDITDKVIKVYNTQHAKQKK